GMYFSTDKSSELVPPNAGLKLTIEKETNKMKVFHRLSCELYSLQHMFICAARDPGGVRNAALWGQLDCEGWTTNRHRRMAFRISRLFYRLGYAADWANGSCSRVRRVFDTEARQYRRGRNSEAKRLAEVCTIDELKEFYRVCEERRERLLADCAERRE